MLLMLWKPKYLPQSHLTEAWDYFNHYFLFFFVVKSNTMHFANPFLNLLSEDNAISSVLQTTGRGILQQSGFSLMPPINTAAATLRTESLQRSLQ